MAGDSPFRHPEPPWRMPVPHDSVVATEYEDVPEEDAVKELQRTRAPGHRDNRGQSPSHGGKRPC